MSRVNSLRKTAPVVRLWVLSKSTQGIVCPTWTRSSVRNLQKHGSTDHDSEAGTGELGSTSLDGAGGLGGQTTGGDNGGLGGGRRSGLASGDGAVAGLADGLGDLGDRDGDGARAVEDGQGGSLGDGVGLATVGEGGRLRAVGDNRLDSLGLVGDGAVVELGDGGTSKSEDGEELHFDCCCGGGIKY